MRIFCPVTPRNKVMTGDKWLAGFICLGDVQKDYLLFYKYNLLYDCAWGRNNTSNGNRVLSALPESVPLQAHISFCLCNEKVRNLEGWVRLSFGRRSNHPRPSYPQPNTSPPICKSEHIVLWCCFIRLSAESLCITLFYMSTSPFFNLVMLAVGLRSWNKTSGREG